MYREVTRGIQVEVEPNFIEQQSDPTKNQYVFGYHVKITNTGTVATQLISRHWIITDGNGEVREVKGAGVIGEQPKLEPGQSYEYESFCPLTTPTGNMRGSYQMLDDERRQFDVKIPLFFLRDMRKLH